MTHPASTSVRMTFRVSSSCSVIGVIGHILGNGGEGARDVAMEKKGDNKHRMGLGGSFGETN